MFNAAFVCGCSTDPTRGRHGHKGSNKRDLRDRGRNTERGAALCEGRGRWR